MANIGHFNAATVDTNVQIGYEPVPPGDYTVIVTDSSMVDVKDKPGQKYLKLEHTIADGKYQNRKIWANLNLWNSNPDAVRMAEGLLGQLCLAAGKHQIQDSSELHGIPVLAKINVRKQKDRDPQNEIAKYYHSGEASTGVATPTNSGPVASGPVGSVPWAQG